MVRDIADFVGEREKYRDQITRKCLKSETLSSSSNTRHTLKRDYYNNHCIKNIYELSKSVKDF